MRGCALQVVGLSVLFACGDAAPSAPGDGGVETEDVGLALDAAEADLGAATDIGAGSDAGSARDAAL